MLEPSLTNYPEHLRTICEFALNRPIRPKVDRQSFDELKPGVDKAIALLDWFEQLQTQLVSLVDTLAKKSTQPAEELAQIVQAIDCCVVLENGKPVAGHGSGVDLSKYDKYRGPPTAKEENGTPRDYWHIGVTPPPRPSQESLGG